MCKCLIRNYINGRIKICYSLGYVIYRVCMRRGGRKRPVAKGCPYGKFPAFSISSNFSRIISPKLLFEETQDLRNLLTSPTLVSFFGFTLNFSDKSSICMYARSFFFLSLSFGFSSFPYYITYRNLQA